MIRLQIKASSPQREREVQEIIGARQIYRQGTDDSLFVDFRLREEADLAALNLNLLLGVRATLDGDMVPY